ncbi:MaoC family dehydratase N-terminal domain-containing protein [Paracoccaceae bacterium Fryx2]|nr:MaoC family dehydratase N-terminal domain-containing protein [Paracoccaceae bacterium Fryx2]
MTHVQTDVMDPARAAALCATLGIDRAPESPLIPFGHQVYFWQAEPPQGLGRDGHPKLGGLIPDVGLPRRMWAGGRLVFAHPLHAGTPAERHTTLDSVTRKTGRSGPLALVTLRHEVWQAGRICVTEWQDLVYRAEATPGAPPPTPPQAPDAAEVTEPAAFLATLLFRYSALTFNGHRIHYDIEYARHVEGYGGLVVHGPLLAQRLMLLAEARLGRLTTFRYRATAPLLAGEAAWLCADGARLWVRGPHGRLCMAAEAG